MTAALRVEALKLGRSPVGLIGTLAVVLGVLALLGAITAGVASGSAELIAKAGPASTLDWTGLVAGAGQITAVAAILGFGTVLAWMFGREFTDGTISGLFALPVSRARIALAKLTIYALWVTFVGLALTISVLVLGLLIGYGMPTATTWASLGRLWVLTILSGGVAIAVALVATLTRSLLAAVSSAIALVIIAQVGALAGAGGWMPVAAPALWALSNGVAVTVGQLALSVAFAVVFTILTGISWARLQLK